MAVAVSEAVAAQVVINVSEIASESAPADEQPRSRNTPPLIGTFLGSPALDESGAIQSEPQRWRAQEATSALDHGRVKAGMLTR